MSPDNPRAWRLAGDIWNEDTLPVMDWEVPHQRKVLPTSMQLRMECSAPVIRVARDIDHKQHEKHADIPALYFAFDVSSWSWSQEIYDVKGRKWEFVVIVEGLSTAPWPLMIVIGRDSLGNINLVSMHRKNRRWLSKLQKGDLDFEKREK